MSNEHRSLYLAMTIFAAQQNIFGGLGLGQGGTVQLEFKNEDGSAVKTATVKAGGGETETLPLYTNKDTITGEASHLCSSDTLDVTVIFVE